MAVDLANPTDSQQRITAALGLPAALTSGPGSRRARNDCASAASERRSAALTPGRAARLSAINAPSSSSRATSCPASKRRRRSRSQLP